jgi:hypothetical protein
MNSTSVQTTVGVGATCLAFAVATYTIGANEIRTSSTSADRLRMERTRGELLLGTSTVVAAKSARAEMVDRMLAIRRRAIANGMTLQTVDEIRSEIEAAREFGA